MTGFDDGQGPFLHAERAPTANPTYKRVSTDQQSTARQNLVLDEAGTGDPVVLEEDTGTSSRPRSLQRPKSSALPAYARPGGSMSLMEVGTGPLLCRWGRARHAPLWDVCRVSPRRAPQTAAVP